MNRTICIVLRPSLEQVDALHETIRQFTSSFNKVCQVGWEQGNTNAYSLHHFTYRDCKGSFPTLVSDLHIEARQKASVSLKSAVSILKKGAKVSCPHSELCPPRYNLHTFKLYWDKEIVSMSTTRGRIKIPFVIPKYALYAVNSKTATADLMYRNHKFYLNVVIKSPDIKFVSNSKAIGVDLGITHPAVTSDNRFHGNKHMAEVSKRNFRLKRALQSNGSKSAKRHLRNLAGRDERFRRDCDHVISASILKGVEQGTTIVVENLTNIRTRCKASRGEAKRRLHSWSFARLKGFLEYKTEDIGCQVIAIDPRHTSQRCNRCGYTYRGNRVSQSEFLCRKCGFHLNADLQASRNIRDKYLVGWSISPSDALPSTSVLSQPSEVRDKLADLSVSS